MKLKQVKAKYNLMMHPYNDDRAIQCITEDKVYNVIYHDIAELKVIDDAGAEHSFDKVNATHNFEFIYDNESGLQDSGERMQFSGGAVREPNNSKGRFDLLDFELLSRVSKHLQAGATKYSPNNWRSGISVSRCADSALRHLSQYINGETDEDHLAACVCNIMFIMNYEKYKPELQDLYMWKEGKGCTESVKDQ